MTDPATLTTGAIVALAFQKFLESGAGELAKKFTEAAISKMDELRQKIWAKLRGNPKAEKALTALEQGSKAELDRLTVYLQDVIEDEPGFAAELQAIAQEINEGKLQDSSSMTQINQDNARGWQTKVEGGTAYVGEIHIHQPPNVAFPENRRVPDSAGQFTRLALFQKLASLPGPQFEQVLFGLNPPAGNVPTAQASQSGRVAALLQWAESIGCGLDQVETVYLQVAYPR